MLPLVYTSWVLETLSDEPGLIATYMVLVVRVSALEPATLVLWTFSLPVRPYLPWGHVSWCGFAGRYRAHRMLMHGRNLALCGRLSRLSGRRACPQGGAKSFTTTPCSICQGWLTACVRACTDMRGCAVRRVLRNGLLCQRRPGRGHSAIGEQE